MQDEVLPQALVANKTIKKSKLKKQKKSKVQEEIDDAENHVTMDPTQN